MAFSKRWLLTILLAVPLAAAGVVYASSQAQTYICPVTGEQLRCPQCCPLTEHSLCDDCEHDEKKEK
jgi:hypothetical protein